MSFLQLAKDRYSLRKFSAQKVEEEKLAQILEAGRLAPTAVNYQPQRVLVVDKQERLEALKQCTSYTFNAPVILVICFDKSNSWKNPLSGEDLGPVDATIVTTHMMMEASELGLGTTFVGYFDPAALRRVLSLPDFLVPTALLPLGYPDASAQPSKLHDLRKPLVETVFRNSFAGVKENKVDPSQHR